MGKWRVWREHRGKVELAWRNWGKFFGKMGGKDEGIEGKGDDD
ncbi:hypothetical protein [Bartonella saheliensis]|nr:hypothetical protein [Bartonella saheliensis]